jgi:hypothetical protein
MAVSSKRPIPLKNNWDFLRNFKWIYDQGILAKRLNLRESKIAVIEKP